MLTKNESEALLKRFYSTKLIDNLEKQMNRAKNKAAAKRIIAPTVQEAKQEIAAPTWLSLGDLTTAGLYVMRATWFDFMVVRIKRVDKGEGLTIINEVRTVMDEPIHQHITGNSQYQKIKEQ